MGRGFSPDALEMSSIVGKVSGPEAPTHMYLFAMGRLGFFDDRGCAIGQDLRDSGGNFRRIIAEGQHCIRTKLFRMTDHELVGIATRPFASFRIETDIAAKKDLNPGADISYDRPRTHDDASNNAEVFHHSIAIQLYVRSYQRMIHIFPFAGNYFIIYPTNSSINHGIRGGLSIRIIRGSVH